ncbi:MAG: response regulator transcription factor [Gammaproteobacteria bacterium]|nr:response regulator transcription factor [Gammaproteobacteria bacterium]
MSSIPILDSDSNRSRQNDRRSSKKERRKVSMPSADKGGTVHVIEDNEGQQTLLRRLLESVEYQVESHMSAEDFIANYKPNTASCLVIDVRLPGMSGLELQEHINTHHSYTPPIIFLTGIADVQMSVRALKAGCLEFIEKPVNEQTLLDCVRKAVRCNKENNEKFRKNNEIQSRIDSLTPKEYDVYKMVLEGMTSKEISVVQSVSYRTVEVHRSNMMKKMKTKSLAELMKMVLTRA